MKELFESFDKDQSGTLTLDELKSGLLGLAGKSSSGQPTIDVAVIDNLFAQVCPM